MGERLAGKVVVISGGTGAIGSAIAKRLVQEGATAILGARTPPDEELFFREYGDHARFVALDVTSEASWTKTIDSILLDGQGIDCLINCAGVWRGATLQDALVDDFMLQVKVNQLGVFLGMRAVATHMSERRAGLILNICSAAGLRGMAGTIGYTSTKWAVRGMTQAAAVELAKYNVRVNALFPGAVSSPMTNENEESFVTAVRRAIPLARLAMPSEVADAALFLVSNDAAYITGAELAVDGGWTAVLALAEGA